MAAQQPRVAVHDETGAAAPASRLPSARGAHERGRIAATVDEDERLLAASLPQRERLGEPRADAVVRCRLAVRRERDLRRRGRVDRAHRQPEPLVTITLDLMQRLERRCRAAEDDRHAALSRAPDRDIAAVVADALLLFERRVVFFVDDRRARAAASAQRRRGASPARDRARLPPPRASARRRAPAGSRLCSVTAHRPGNARATRASSCGVRLISGTSKSACRPSAMHAAAAAR